MWSHTFTFAFIVENQQLNIFNFSLRTNYYPVMSGDDLAASFLKELCTKTEPYSEKDDMTTGILVVESQRLYVSKEVRQTSQCELTSLYG